MIATETRALAAAARAGNGVDAMRDVVAILKADLPHYTWVGIYLLEGEELVLGPFLGKPSPHVRIPLNRGICGAAASEKRTIIVDDVHSDPRYLACSLETRSEIVVPIMKDGRVLGEIDIDSDRAAAFGAADHAMLERVATALADALTRPARPRGVTLVPGDGIGPEITEVVVRVIDAAGVAIDWDRHDAGVLAVERGEAPLPAALLASIRERRVALKGPVTTPIGKGFTSVNVGLRKALNLYANLRPVKNIPGVSSRFQGVDLVIVRENTEDLYAGLEHEVVPGVVESLKIITAAASTRIAEFAFRYAVERGRRAVTAIHKANIMKLGDGLFLESVRAVAARHPDIPYDERIVDAACMHLVMRPERFDVLLLPNLYGDIVSDLCAGLVGGLGVVPGANIGAEAAVFEAVHGSAPDIAGQNVANPTALLLSACLMLDHVGEPAAATRIRAAIETAVAGVGTRTRDLGGTAGTREFGDAIIRQL